MESEELLTISSKMNTQ